MEWLIPVNEMFTEKITKLNHKLIPPGFHGDVRSLRLMQENLSKVIDYLGELSASTQGLRKVITSADKLRNSPDHFLYLLKDAKAKDGKGDVIGLLKMGRKHLFLLDEKDKLCEVEPFCVLDFFVLGDRQRYGYGKELFDHMLKDLDVPAHELAIDGPSPKMEQFLQKNYNINHLKRQNNNFAVSPQFFGALPDISSKSGRSTPAITPQVGRFSATKPVSAIANVIHGSNAGQGRSNGCSPSELSHLAEPEVAQNDENVIEAPEEEINEANNQKSPERPCTLQVVPVTEAPPSAPSPAGSMSSRRDSQLTDRGYFDVKFYHNKLW